MLKNTVSILIGLLCCVLTSSASAGLVYHCCNTVEGGLTDPAGPGTTFTAPGQNGHESLETPEGGVNNLRWAINEGSFVVNWQAAGGAGFAFVQTSWFFSVVGDPVDFVIESSQLLINTRLYEAVPGGSNVCISLGCETDNLLPGTQSGTLGPGDYVFEFTPSVQTNTSFLLTVPEPSSLTLLVMALAGFQFRKRFALKR